MGKTYNIKGMEAIYCPTMKDKKRVSKLLYELGYKWNSGKTYKERGISANEDYILYRIGFVIGREIVAEGEVVVISASEFIKTFRGGLFDKVEIKINAVSASILISLFFGISFVCYIQGERVNIMQIELAKRENMIKRQDSLINKIVHESKKEIFKQPLNSEKYSSD